MSLIGTPPTVETLLVSEMTRNEALSIGQLLVAIWPKPGVTVEGRANSLDVPGAGDYPASTAPRSLLIRKSGRVLAHASVFPREIETTAGPLTIAALARVCTDPSCRGQNLGALVARAAFQMVDDGHLPFSLFQTTPPVQSFYERLGCGVVENRIVNSLADDPEACPFWDKILMRYPANRTDWPTGDIDLRGHGY